MRKRKLSGFVALIAGLALCAGGIWSLFSPAQYQAAVRVQVRRDNPDVYQPYDPYFFLTEFEIVRSGGVLSNVVENLNLLRNWGGRQYTMAAAIHRLERRT